MSDYDPNFADLIYARRYPDSLHELYVALQEMRAVGIECARDEAQLRGHDELAEELTQRAHLARAVAAMRPPIEEFV